MGRLKVQSTQGSGWQPLPKGTYAFTIDAVEEKTSSGGFPQVILKMSVLDGEYAGKQATHFLVLHAKSAGFVKELCEATGAPYEEVELEEVDQETGKPLVEIEFDTDDFIGKTLQANVGVREHEGKEQNTFNKFVSLGGTDDADEAPAPKAEAKRAQPAAAAAAPAKGQSAAAPAKTAQRTPAGNQQRQTRSRV